MPGGPHRACEAGLQLDRPDQDEQLPVCRRPGAGRIDYRWPGRSVRRDLGGNLKFVAPLGEIPKEFQVADSEKSEKDATEKPANTKPTTQLSEKATPEPAKDALNVKDLALTKDASDIEYQELVEHVAFKSKANVKSVCTELAANLKAQGWTKDGSDLITAASSILKRKRGDAELTIFVKPESGGSEVKIFTDGLSWDEK